MPNAEPLFSSQVAQFLNDIGLPAISKHRVKKSFLPAVQILNGQILFCPETALPSDLLHEAGHLAVVPAKFRPLMSGDLISGTELMFEQCHGLDPDDQLSVNAMQAGECEATAWSWAAGFHLGLAPDVIITNRSYGGDGEWVRLGLRTSHYLGIHGLARAGFCEVRRQKEGDVPFPKLRRWLQC